MLHKFVSPARFAMGQWLKYKYKLNEYINKRIYHFSNR